MRLRYPRMPPGGGALFETWVVSEMIKQRLNAGQPTDLYFWRDSTGHEIDVLFEMQQGLQAIEIKSGATFAADWTASLAKWRKFAGEALMRKPYLVYGGEESFERDACHLTGWRDLSRLS